MTWVSRLTGAWRTVADGRRLDAELDAELAGYVNELVERRVSAGEDEAAARRAVLVEVGGIDQVKEGVRDVRPGRLVEELLRDVRYAWRGLRRAPTLALAAVATLALGVGATTAIFSVAHTLLLRPLPFRAPDRLVFVWADQTSEGYPRAPLSGPELGDLDERARHFEGFGAIWATTAALTGEAEPEQLRIGHVTSDFFTLLGAEPALGRTFRVEDETTGAAATILLGAPVWKRRYGADPGIVGRRVDVNGQPAVVIGVMPEGFRLMMPPDSAVPDDLDAWMLLNRRFTEGLRGQRFLRVIGRMRPGVDPADAVADVARVGREISAAHAFYGTSGRRFETVPLHEDAVRDVRRPLWLLTAGALVLMAIACTNVAGLLVARSAARARESAVRTALGAGPLRLARQALVEALILAALGAAAGAVVGSWLLALLVRFTPDALDRLRMATLNAPVLAASVALVAAWMALLAAAPALESIRHAPAAVLHDGRGQTAGRAKARLRGALTVAQVALSVVMVVAAVLLARTVQRVQRMDTGFSAEGVLSFRLALPATRYANQDAFNAFSRRLQQALGALPGVSGAGLMSHAPYDHVPNWGGPYTATEGADPSTAPQADYRAVAPGTLELLAVRVVDGRAFTEQDDPRSAPVVMVDDRLARRLWPGDSAVGRRVAVDPRVLGIPATWATIVGVVRHVRHRSPIEEVRDQVYFPLWQATRNPSVYLLKTTGDAGSLAPAVREAVRALDPALPIYDVRPLSRYVDEARAIRAYTALLAALFAAAALALSAIGIYGVVAHGVTERRRELGVRVALGATSRQVGGLVLREGMRLTMAGLAIGLAGAAAGSFWIRAELVGVAPWDPFALAACVGLLAAASALACWAPVRRALGASPAAVLREG